MMNGGGDSSNNCETKSKPMEAKNIFWKEPNSSYIPKLPGKVMEETASSLGKSSSSTTGNSSKNGSKKEWKSEVNVNKLKQHHRSSSHPGGHSRHVHGNCKSFECFTASCDDAWDSQIDECLSNDISTNDISKSSSPPGVKCKTTSSLSSSTSPSSSSSLSGSALPSTSTAKTTPSQEKRSQQQQQHLSNKSAGNTVSGQSGGPIKSNEASPGSTSLLTGKGLGGGERVKMPATNNQSNDANNLTSGSSSSTSSQQKQTMENKPSVNRRGILSREVISSAKQSMMDSKLQKLKKIIYDDEVTDLNELRSMAWAGVPPAIRHVTWKLLLGYLPVVREKRPAALERKRTEYQHLVEKYYNNNRLPDDEIWRQIHIDIPRMQPLVSIFQQDIVQRIFQRILYIYSIRHPASGYVQGMNDLVIPFFVVYLSEFIPGHSLAELESLEVSTLSNEVLKGVEADAFWSLNKLLDSIQDNYTFAQPGIQSLVNLLARVMSRIDSNLHEHLTRHNVHYLLFSFRWMNNLLIRELPLRCIIRLWDTYLAEGALTSANVAASTNTFTPALLDSKLPSVNTSLGNGSPFAASFHLYVCAAFLRYWSKNLLQENDFQGLILYLQNLPTFHWGDTEIELLVADAYSLKETFTPNHLLSS